MKIARLVMPISASILLMLLLTGCFNARKNIHLDWKEKPDALTILITDPYVNETSDIAEEIFEFAPDDITDWFVAQLREEFMSASGIKPEIRVMERADFKVTNEPLGEEQIAVPYPVLYRVDGLNGLVLSIHPMEFFHEEDPCPAFGSCNKRKRLMVKGGYSFMDVNSKKVPCYGDLLTEYEFTDEMTEARWKELMREIVKSILYFTPLVKK